MSAPVVREHPARQLRDQRRKVSALSKRPAPPMHPVVIPIQLFAPWQQLRTGERDYWYVTQASGLDGWELTAVGIYVTQVSSSGVVEVMIMHDADDALTIPITIDAGDFTDTGATAYEIDPGEATFLLDERVGYRVDEIGTETRGLGVDLRFDPPA